MANVCERCKRSMSSHDDHASCPQFWMAAGKCHLDIENSYNICGGWTSKQWMLRRSLVDARARASQRGRQHWTAAFPRLEAWILARPASASSSRPTSEISSLVGEGDYGTQYGTPAVSRAKHNGTHSSYLCAIGSSGHAQCHSRSSGHAQCQSRS